MEDRGAHSFSFPSDVLLRMLPDRFELPPDAPGQPGIGTHPLLRTVHHQPPPLGYGDAELRVVRAVPRFPRTTWHAIGTSHSA
ncbi:hypothetical protein GCM10010276_08620 [Streptomyces longisporus]|uniref:Uncharacterized protein n=1 Tax=Streptomyces longisporus TaxID=1948 RepID=A0ABP5Y5Q5_STRLO